jgi:hypothetical protein
MRAESATWSSGWPHSRSADPVRSVGATTNDVESGPDPRDLAVPGSAGLQPFLSCVTTGWVLAALEAALDAGTHGDSWLPVSVEDSAGTPIGRRQHEDVTLTWGFVMAKVASALGRP